MAILGVAIGHGFECDATPLFAYAKYESYDYSGYVVAQRVAAGFTDESGRTDVMMESIRPDHPLRTLFCGMVEHAFCTRVGLCDPALTGYLADLLVEFTHVERHSAIRHAEGKGLKQMAAMLSVLLDEKPENEVDRDRTIYRRIGDYTLFWAGVYPEQLRRANPDVSDVLVEYVSQGKKSYAIVSELADEGDNPPSSMFRHLSEDFEYCLYGLGLVRRGWEHRPEATGGELLY